ncbi:riboflavin synthase subunit alpha [Solimonas terrae]|uniref:Riboflavin synthase n=1 Tax=Solimonas terrae TaxID=1396819 RepID=A0A6M2BMD4_9GAMM|nr:riboflavin synthase subunit alpha [Solimonas terrae]NGY03259.1 riboflavin synthase subunit alpha [Solimonas terrae]
MFTGIVGGVARITSVQDRDGIRSFVLDFPDGFCEGLAIGASVSVDGTCLTVTHIHSPTRAAFDVVLQSLVVTTLGRYAVGDLVNVERAARDGAEIGGHPLSGHVDFSAVIETINEAGGNKSLRIAIPETFRRYVFAKGYIAVNGASLTVSECDKRQGWFEVWLIPETRRVTTLDGKQVGDSLNIEIERGTQVVVDTVRDTVRESLGKLQPLLEALLQEKGLTLDELIELPEGRISRLP